MATFTEAKATALKSQMELFNHFSAREEYSTRQVRRAKEDADKLAKNVYHSLNEVVFPRQHARDVENQKWENRIFTEDLQDVISSLTHTLDFLKVLQASHVDNLNQLHNMA